MKDTTAPHLLVVGFGSVGKRHAQNLRDLGCRISCCDPQASRRAEEAGAPEGRYADMEAALAADAFDGVVVCSPTRYHPDQVIRALEAGLPVLLEKPVAVSLAEAERIEAVARAASAPLLLGYTWRWWEPLSRVRTLLAEGGIGALRYVQFFMSAHLADWHPWERYQDWFMSSKAEGGGALLDESHWIDLMHWFFGRPTRLRGTVETISDLEIDADDNVDFLAEYPNRLRVYVHLDLYGRPHERFIRFVGEAGTLYWTSAPNQIRITTGAEFNERIETFDCERNDMFLGVAKEFLEMLRTGRAPRCTLADGLEVMRVIEAVRTSSARGAAVTLDPDAAGPA